LRDGQSFMIAACCRMNRRPTSSRFRGSRALRCSASCSPAALICARNRSGHHRHAALGAAGTARFRIATPLDNAVPANDPDYFLTGHAELTRPDQRAMAPYGNPSSGHVLDLAKGGTNVVAVRN
jgi:hypothetical protein